jgi:hypothetical protein
MPKKSNDFSIKPLLYKGINTGLFIMDLPDGSRLLRKDGERLIQLPGIYTIGEYINASIESFFKKVYCKCCGNIESYVKFKKQGELIGCCIDGEIVPDLLDHVIPPPDYGEEARALIDTFLKQSGVSDADIKMFRSML